MFKTKAGAMPVLIENPSFGDWTMLFTRENGENEGVIMDLEHIKALYLHCGAVLQSVEVPA